MSFRNYAVRELSYDIGAALEGAGLATWRRDALKAALEKCDAQLFSDSAERRRRTQVDDDLRKHLRDRDAHIANLEAQLRPMLQPVPMPETETML